MTIGAMSQHDSSPAPTPGLADRIAGCLVGLAVGDALGAPLEVHSRQQVRKRFQQGLRDMIASNLWSRGEYTNDTQMALLIAESLLQKKGFVASDLAQRFQAWVSRGTN
jgi:ADP-ribosyl-[dinitrogen reductase] hydrolase